MVYEFFFKSFNKLLLKLPEPAENFGSGYSSYTNLASDRLRLYNTALLTLWCVAAMQKLNGSQLGGAGLEISLAKPPSDKKKKEDMLRKREHRMMQAMAERYAFFIDS